MRTRSRWRSAALVRISAECDWCIAYVRRCGAEVVGPAGFAAMSRAEFNTYTLTVALRCPGISADWCADFIRRCGARNFTRYLGAEHGYEYPARSLVVDKYNQWGAPHGHFNAGRAADVLRVLATLPSYSPNPHPHSTWEGVLMRVLGMDANDAGMQRFVRILLEAPPGAKLNIIWDSCTRKSLVDMLLAKRGLGIDATEKLMLACELARRRFLLYRILQLPKTSRYRLPGQPELAAPRLDQDLAKCVARQLTL